MACRYRLTAQATICPNCGYKRYKRYRDTLTGKLLPDQFGRCNRENSCSYELFPPADFLREWERTNGTGDYSRDYKSDYVPKARAQEQAPTYYYPFEDVAKSLPLFKLTKLFDFVRRYGERQRLERCLRLLPVGGDERGNVVYWQIDERNRVRAGKVIGYNADGHRNRAINYFVPRPENTALKQCLFGLNQLREMKRGDVCGIVESEKTAIMCSIVFPSIFWLATGGSKNLNPERIAPLRENGVPFCVFPDSDQAGQEWLNICARNGWNVYNFAFEVTTEEERAKGYDLGDLLADREKRALLLADFCNYTTLPAEVAE